MQPHSPVVLFTQKFLKDWWARMSCAAFTFLGTWVAAADKGKAWVLWGSFALGLAFFFVAAYRVWAKEHEIVVELTETLNVAILVHGISTRVAVAGRVLVIVPDVSIINNSHGLGVALTADLWMLRSRGMECWCAPEAKPVPEWEQSQHSYRNKALAVPINLGPRSTDAGYLAFCHMVGGFGNEPLVDEHGHMRYRIEFRDVHANSVIHQQEITVSPHLETLAAR